MRMLSGLIFMGRGQIILHVIASIPKLITVEIREHKVKVISNPVLNDLPCIPAYWSSCETWEIRTPLRQTKSVPNSEVSAFQGAICIENILGPDKMSFTFITGCPHFTVLLFTGVTVV
jgi:hypothetical protein